MYINAFFTRFFADRSIKTLWHTTAHCADVHQKLPKNYRKLSNIEKRAQKDANNAMPQST